MKEKDKYYTPRLEDFIYGLEYEVRTKTGWHNCVFGYEFNDVIQPEEHWSVPFKELIKTESIRVKYLDKEEVEDLGFTHDYDLPNNYVKGGIDLLFNPLTNFIKIDDADCLKDYFQGYIKNKSELKKLMEQLNIKAEDNE